MNMTEKKIHIVKQSITKFEADCIVNAANEGLWEGGGVCGAIFRAAGSKELTKACNSIGHCDTGKAVITPAFNLAARYIIHAVGPVYHDGKHGEPEQLYDCYKCSLELAKEYDCHSIVFPVISSGIFGYPVDNAWRKAIRACTNFLNKNPQYDLVIYFAVLNDNMVELGKKTLQEICGEKETKDKEIVTRSKQQVTKEDRVEIFNDTQSWINSNSNLMASVTFAKQHTEVFYEDEYPAFNQDKNDDQIITVSKDRSYAAAMRLHKEDPGAKIAVMNFANAFHPGGGVTKGASAQEESLCRCSTLYPILYRRTLRDSFYKYHSDRNTAKASDTMIYTEGVVICKTDTNYPERMEEKDWVTVDVMTIAAPDLRPKSNAYAEIVAGGTYMNNAELFGYHVKRAIHMLTVAASKGADVLVLGAFGCGAFENDPQTVAKAYKCAIGVFPKVFKKIEFAIYSTGYDKKDNYSIFSEVLNNQ